MAKRAPQVRDQPRDKPLLSVLSPTLSVIYAAGQPLRDRLLHRVRDCQSRSLAHELQAVLPH